MRNVPTMPTESSVKYLIKFQENNIKFTTIFHIIATKLLDKDLAKLKVHGLN